MRLKNYMEKILDLKNFMFEILQKKFQDLKNLPPKNLKLEKITFSYN